MGFQFTHPKTERTIGLGLSGILALIAGAVTETTQASVSGARPRKVGRVDMAEWWNGFLKGMIVGVVIAMFIVAVMK